MLNRVALIFFLCATFHSIFGFVRVRTNRLHVTSMASQKRLSSNSKIKFDNGVPLVRQVRRKRDVNEDIGGAQQILLGKDIMSQGKPISRPDIINVNRLKVLGGTAKGMKIDSPNVYLRPMMAKVKEALFSSLASMDLFDGSEVRVLDLFSGSGSIGLEALSRGASYATFVDMSSECTSTALRNANTCGFSQKVSTACTSALDALQHPHRHNIQGTYDLITLTPPYEEVNYSDLISAVCNSSLVKENTIVVIEYPEEMDKLKYVLGDNQLFGVRNRKYGRTVLAVYVFRPGRKFDLRPDEFV